MNCQNPTDNGPEVQAFSGMRDLAGSASIVGGARAHRHHKRHGGSSVGSLFIAVIALLTVLSPFALATATVDESYVLTPTDRSFLDELQRRAVLFFIDHSDPATGLTKDRAPTDGSDSDAPASVAATGFALTAWCIADSRGWIPPGEAARRVHLTLKFAADQLQNVHGWYYHFVEAATGRRSGNCEVSTIDTALFLQGAVLARQYLKDALTAQLVDRIYRRIDWHWALNGRTTLSMGWMPETGFIPYYWDNYCELMGLYLLGIGAPENPLPASAWSAWRRGPQVTFDGRTFIQCGPLFTHQYSHAWFDFRGVRDDFADYWQNSVDATLAQRDWSAAQHRRFPHWSDEMWGLTASDGPHGYMAWGTPGPGKDESDGTLVPCAPGGSLPFAPRECLTTLENMREEKMPGLWGRYGFADAFNPETGWVASDVIGINVGITLMMAENLRTGLIWQRFMAAPEVRRAMTAARFEPIQPIDTPSARIATIQAKPTTRSQTTVASANNG